MRLGYIGVCVVLLAVSASCAQKGGEGGRNVAASSAAAAPVVGQANAAGSFLAYTHSATVRTAADDIPKKLSAVRAACMDGRHGKCVVLGESLNSGEWPSGELELRAEPKAIEPLVAMAADGAELARRGTEAEDLADAVRDNGLRQKRLNMQHARLLEFLGRRDIKAEDLIALSNQLSQIEADLQAAEQEAAQQLRRIQTNRLTLRFETSQVTAQSSRLGESLREAGSILDASLAVLVTVLVASLPFMLVILLAAWALRTAIRRRRNRG